MLTVHQPKILSRNLVLYDGDSSVAEIGFKFMSPHADVRIGTARYTATRTGWLSAVYALDQNGRVVCRADSVGFWRRAYEIRWGGSLFTLRRRPGWFDTGWDLFDGDSPVGSVTRKGFFQTETIADFANSVDLATQVFIVWMVNVLWQQDQAAAAAAG